MKRILAACALLMAGLLAGAWASAQMINGLGGVYVNGQLQGAGSGSGTVTSVGLTLPPFMNVSGTNPITTSGTFVFGLANVSAGAVFAGPASGADAEPAFRLLATTDFASPDASGVLTSDGAGALSWEVAGVSGANTALSNLGTTAINANLNPGTDASYALGSNHLRFTTASFSAGVYIWDAIDDDQPQFYWNGNGFCVGAGGSSAVDSGVERTALNALAATNCAGGYVAWKADTLEAISNVSSPVYHGGTDQFTYTFIDLATDLPATLDVPSIYVNRARAIHITEVYCEADTADGAVINLTNAGDTVLSGDLTCTTAGAASISFVSGKDAVALNAKLSHVMVSVLAGLKRLNVVVKYTVD